MPGATGAGGVLGGAAAAGAPATMPGATIAQEIFPRRPLLAAQHGVIDKNAQCCDMIGEALAALTTGQKWFSPTFHRAREQQNRDPAFFGKLLSPREQEVLGLIGQGLSDKEIAAQIGIARRTVEDHRSNLLHKLQLDSTAKLAAIAIKHGFTPVLLAAQAN